MRKKVARTFKLSVLVLAIIPILVFLGFVGAVNLIDFNRYKPQIEQEVSELTHREFKIDGAVDISVAPFVLTIGESSLQHSRDFGEDQPQIRFKELRAELSLWALFLDKKVQVKSLEWIEPQIYLSVNDKQQNNWEDLPGVDEVIGFFGSDQARAKQDDEDPHKTRSWQLNSLVVQDAKVMWRDDSVESNQNDWHLTDISIVANQVGMNQVFPITVAMKYLNPQSNRQIDGQISAEAKILEVWQGIEVRDWQGVLKSHLLKQQKYPAINFTQKGELVRLNWQTDTLQVSGIELQGLNGRMQLDFTGEISAHPTLKGSIKTYGVDYAKWSDQLQWPIPESIAKHKLTNEDSVFDWQLEKTEWKIEKVSSQVIPEAP